MALGILASTLFVIVLVYLMVAAGAIFLGLVSTTPITFVGFVVLPQVSNIHYYVVFLIIGAGMSAGLHYRFGYYRYGARQHEMRHKIVR
jgi:membrane protein DedA with SNARE-associated domain